MSIFLEQLSPEEAKSILRILYRENQETANRIEELAKTHFSKIKEESVAETVYGQLVAIDVEDIWNRSGPKRFGYIEPVVAAYEIIEETLEPFAVQLRKYRTMAMYQEMEKTGIGLAKGILKFTREGDTEFKEWAPDDAIEWLHGMLSELEKESKNPVENECIRKISQILNP